MRSNPGESAGAENFDLLLFAPNMVIRKRKKAALLRPPPPSNKKFDSDWYREMEKAAAASRVEMQHGACCAVRIHTLNTFASAFCILCFPSSYHDLLNSLYALTLFSANFDSWQPQHALKKRMYSVRSNNLTRSSEQSV